MKVSRVIWKIHVILWLCICNELEKKNINPSQSHEQSDQEVIV